MSTNSLRPNVQDLQRDALTLLSDVENLMSKVSKLLKSDNSDESNDKVKEYEKYLKKIADAKSNIANLELVMAIVAPMKAGKSTIINAIIGQDILPSRASAMTTLPTEILLRSKKSQPVLRLDSIEVLRSTLENLQQKIQLYGEDCVADEMAKYPHLRELIQKIRDGFPIEPETTGLEEIKQTLTNLNDIVRVCTVLDPKSNPLRQADFNIPRISIPFWKPKNTSQAKLLGNLVIVDTPGPNEAGNLGLSAVVEEQLRRSSMVLIVLDFTQLNNEAAAEIQRQVQPVIDLLGKDSLYVLVNKVDQRTEQDPMTSEKVKQFVQADLHWDSSSDVERVFEISARQAFCAASFLSEMQNNPGIKKEDMKTTIALAEQVLGPLWRQRFASFSLEELQVMADQIWEISGFEPFLKNAINILMESAAPRCIKSELILIQDCLRGMNDYVNTRSKAINADEKLLREAIGGFNKDLEDLELSRHKLKKIDDIKNNLQKQLSKLLEELKEEARVSLEDYFREKEHESGDLEKKWTSLLGKRFLLFLTDSEKGFGSI